MAVTRTNHRLLTFEIAEDPEMKDRIKELQKMETVNPDNTLAELVNQRPALASTFSRLGLDFCCGGASTLTEAVSESPLEMDEVLAQIAAESDVPDEDWNDLGPNDLIDHVLHTHHDFLKRELPRLEALANKVASVHSERHPELERVMELTAALRADLEPHLWKEENVLFPRIREYLQHSGGVDRQMVAAPVSVMEAEHDVTGEVLALLRRASNDYVVPADGCGSYIALYAGLEQLEADTHLHVHKENNLLFPAVLSSEQAPEPNNASAKTDQR